MSRLILMKKGGSPIEKQVREGDDEAVLKELKKVWNGELDGIMIMRS